MMCRHNMEPQPTAPATPENTAPPMDIIEARALVRHLLGTVAPNVDVATIDRYETLQDVADLDSLDFINLMTAAAAATGTVIPPSDYPEVITLERFAAYLVTHRADTP